MKLLSVKLIHQEDTKMRKFLSLFLAGCLIFLLPATIWASAETTYESEQGQAMIKAPSSSVFGSGDPLIQPMMRTVRILTVQKATKILFLPELTGQPQIQPPAPLPITQALPYVSIRDIRAAGST